MEIAAAAIPQSFTAWRDFVARAASAADVLHLDVCDGKFVPSRSWPLAGDDGSWARFVSQEEGMPGWQGSDFEADLMVANPERIAGEFVEAGFTRLIVHWEALRSHEGGAAATLERLVADARVDIWLSASPATDPAEYLGALGFVAGFQCMGIAKVGFQGEPFDRRALDIVRLVRASRPELPIAVDGGVSVETADDIAAVGARKLVVGSAIVKAEDPLAAAEAIRDAAEIS